MTDTTDRTPAEELRAAANVLDHAAARATQPPWHSSLVWSPDAKSTSAVYSHAHPTGTVESEVVASGRIRSGYGGIRNPHNAVWIKLVSPAVAAPLKAWLESEANQAGKVADPRNQEIIADPNALALAREINAAVKR
jgi:hypothetical protein